MSSLSKIVQFNIFCNNLHLKSPYYLLCSYPCLPSLIVQAELDIYDQRSLSLLYKNKPVLNLMVMLKCFYATVILHEQLCAVLCILWVSLLCLIEKLFGICHTSCVFAFQMEVNAILLVSQFQTCVSGCLKYMNS